MTAASLGKVQFPAVARAARATTLFARLARSCAVALGAALDAGAQELLSAGVNAWQFMWGRGRQ